MARVNLIQLRRGTAAAWTSANPVLEVGEPGLETDTLQMKYGDGATEWISLPYAASTTRETGRATSTELLFNKNLIQMNKIVQSGPLVITVADSGNIVNQESVIETEIQSNGVDTITFQGFQYFSNIAQGEVLEAGTYQVFFLRLMNGRLTVSVVKPSYEVSNLIPLATPTNFVMVPGAGDPEDELDATWDLVENATNIVIELSATGGGGPWTLPITLAGNAISYTRTGLDPGTTYHQRVRAIGDLVSFANSNYAITAATTEDAADMTAPTFTFDPADTDTDVPVNGVATITSTVALRDQDGVTEITNANLGDYVTVEDTLGNPLAHTKVIDVTKKIITITPDVSWPPLDDVVITIDGVESAVNGVHAVSDSATFTVSDFTLHVNNTLTLGDILDSVFAADNADFSLEFTVKEMLIAGPGPFFRKYDTGQRSFIYQTDNAGTVTFKFYEAAGVEFTASSREIKWANALTDNLEHTIKLWYKGAIDTNNGLDRVELYIDGVLVSAGKSLVVGGAHAWPFLIRNTTAPLIIGPAFTQIKDIIIRSANDTVVEVNIPIVRTGEDISGNNRDGVWS